MSILHAFPGWDATPGVDGMYGVYNARMNASWVAQHPYHSVKSFS